VTFSFPAGLKPREEALVSYAFVNPIKPGKVNEWRGHVKEMTTTQRAAWQASRKKLGLTEKVWLQQTPMGDFAVVYWEAPDIGKVFHEFLTSSDPFDKWFRDKVLIDVHGMDPSAPPPPMNQVILG
jgi:hypothetical protein